MELSKFSWEEVLLKTLFKPLYMFLFRKAILVCKADTLVYFCIDLAEDFFVCFLNFMGTFVMFKKLIRILLSRESASFFISE